MPRRRPEHVAVTRTSRNAYRSAVVDRRLDEPIRYAIQQAFERMKRPLSGRELDREARARHEEVSSVIVAMKKHGELWVHHEGLDRVTNKKVEWLAPHDWSFSKDMVRLCAEAEPPPFRRPDDPRTAAEIIMDYLWTAQEAGQLVNRRMIERDTGLSHQTIACVRELVKRGQIVVDRIDKDHSTQMDVEWLKPGKERPPQQASLL
jgi:hypothetical protein